MKLIIINGPNLNLLGIREKNIYGKTSFDSYYKTLIKKYKGKVDLEYYQSNHEGELIEKIQKIGFSVALRDAISSVTTPEIEVHISNILSREDFRKKSYLSDVCTGIISGLGLMGYEAAINYFSEKND